MNSSGDAAESIVRMSLQGFEVAAKITGSGAKNVGALIIAIMKDKRQTKGKTSLTNMLKSGKELKVFSIKQDDLKKFTEEAKRYGVLYSALIDKRQKNSPDGIVDIMVRAEDASKINRIVTRFKLSAVNTANIKSEIEKEMIDKTIKEAMEKGVEVKSVEDQLVDDILSKPIQKEEKEVSNPNLAKTEKSPQSEPSLKNKSKSEEGTKSKPSVRETLKEIKKEQVQEKVKEKDLDKGFAKKEKNKSTKIKHKKSKERG